MPTINKPAFPQGVDANRLSRSLEAIESKVESLKGADGQVDVDKLKEAVADDPVVAEDLGYILDQFDDYVPARAGRPPDSLNPRPISGGCSGPAVAGWQTSPSELDPGKVSSVMDLLLKVKEEVGQVDRDGDGVISQGEVEQARQGIESLPNLEERLVRTALYDADPDVKAFFDDLSAYKNAKQSFPRTVAARKNASERLEKNARHHAASDTGADALLWAYRSMLVKTSSFGMDVLPDRMNNEAKAAETSVFRFVPFSGVRDASGHLNDEEIKRFLGTDDLEKFVETKKAEVLGEAGGDWAAWLDGAGLARPE